MTLFPEWLASQPPTPPVLPQRIKAMHQLHGVSEGKVCGGCCHLVEHRPGQNTYAKCELNRVTSGPGTDWRKRWPACGRFEERNE